MSEARSAVTGAPAVSKVSHCVSTDVGKQRRHFESTVCRNCRTQGPLISLNCVILVLCILLFNYYLFDVFDENVCLLYLCSFILQGDYTRTGEIRFSGMMKDGVNSANRLFNAFMHNIVREIDFSYTLV